MGFTWNGKYYLNVMVPFGGASSCRIFERVASVLQWVVTNKTGWKWISHYLDDYSMLGKTQQELEVQINKFHRHHDQNRYASGGRENARPHIVLRIFRTVAESHQFNTANTRKEKVWLTLRE